MVVFTGADPVCAGHCHCYLLQPVVDCFARFKINRTLAALIILSLFIVVALVVLALIVPPAAREAGNLIEKMPGYIDTVFEWLSPHIAWLQERLGDAYPADAKSFLRDNIGKLFAVTGGIVGGLASGGSAVVDFMTTLVLTPLVAFFMMREWPAITGWVENLIPRNNEDVVRDLLKQINQKISGFIRGQLSVAFLLGMIYAVALSVAGLNYGFLIGLSAGVLSIIPMVGSTLGLLVSITVAWFQSGELSYVAIIGGIFVVGQILEGNVLSPKLVGDSVGMHPLWVIFAVMAGGSLFGILGMLLAVPVAAVIGVLAGFAILQYKGSALYKKHVAKKTKDPVNHG
jgi:predicted PurR-regulated permease PerM